MVQTTATHYRADNTRCGLDPGGYTVAISAVDFAASATCGGCIEVSGGNGRVIARIVDRCPACKPGELDLSRETFAILAPLERGRIAVRWRPVACAVDGPLSFRIKDGSNPQWLAVQVVDHRYPISQLEALTKAGYRPLKRTDYNYFIATGLGRDPVTLRITDVRGHVLEQAGIATTAGTVSRGSAQLPACDDRELEIAQPH